MGVGVDISRAGAGSKVSPESHGVSGESHSLLPNPVKRQISPMWQWLASPVAAESCAQDGSPALSEPGGSGEQTCLLFVTE